MLDYNFQLIFKKGDKMPANYLSRNEVSAISLSSQEMEELKDGDERNLGLEGLLGSNDVLLQHVLPSVCPKHYFLPDPQNGSQTTKIQCSQ